jgi:uncharacterized protein (TIRG00374 family)
LPLWVLPAACALSFLNYCVRFTKWQRYCKLLGIELERRTSFLIYLSGLALSVTPGKMGEVFKSWLVRKVTGVRIHQSAPIVLAERFTDLLGYLILVAIGGIAAERDVRELAGVDPAWISWTLLAACAAMIALVGSRWFAKFTVSVVGHTPMVKRLAPRVEGAFASARILLAPRELLVPTLVSVIGWGLECTGFWLIANAIVPDSVPFLFAIFAFALSAVAGAVALIAPGGLGITEGLLGKLLRPKYQPYADALIGAAGDVSRKTAQGYAAAAVILTRLCTLWFAVLVGVVALAKFTKQFGAVDEAPDD